MTNYRFKKSNQQITENKVLECIFRKQSFVFRLKRKKNKKYKQESSASGSRAMHGIFDCSTVQAIPGLTLQHKWSLPLENFRLFSKRNTRHS